ncbi:hypothetical protein A0J61_09970 [Choanephora cucurbitarum]|uniref:Aspartic peptidase DDI1-type domain-containing protein n=1 Tax=Choanephora cucurbitarum TaxID=101091 RepID=A0A1C7MYX8_9FUNG|nr:hypothetical protein A0J61_09970 [Choanephora cucurbitarum]
MMANNNGNLSIDLVPFDFNSNRRPSNRFIEVEHTVLASETISPIKLHYFHGSEEEDFGSLEDSLNDFFGTKKTEDNKHQLSYLRSLLRGIARIDFMKKYPNIDDLKYDDVISAMRSKYSSTKNLIKKMKAFEETTQYVGESPANFFVRVSEMAAKAKVTDETAIFRRFRYGLWKNQMQHRLQGTNQVGVEQVTMNNVPTVIERKREQIPESVPFNIENLKSMIEDVIERKIKGMRTNDNQNRTYQKNRNNNRYQDGGRNRDFYRYNDRYDNRNHQGPENNGRQQNQGTNSLSENRQSTQKSLNPDQPEALLLPVVKTNHKHTAKPREPYETRKPAVKHQNQTDKNNIPNQEKTPLNHNKNTDKEMTEAKHDQFKETPRKTKVVHSISQRIKETGYDIVADTLDSQAGLSRKQLLHLVPSFKKDLRSGTSNIANDMRKTGETENLNILAPHISDKSPFTAAFTTLVCNGNKVEDCLVDCGACQNIISEQAMKEMGLEIDASSQVVFTLGNTSKQASLGQVYDVPINIGDVTIPVTMEMLPNSPAPIVLGTDFLKRAKADLDFDLDTMTITYKRVKAGIPIRVQRQGKLVDQILPRQPPVHMESDQVDEDSEVDYEEEIEDDFFCSLGVNESQQSIKQKNNPLLLPTKSNNIITIHIPKKKEHRIIEINDHFVNYLYVPDPIIKPQQNKLTIHLLEISTISKKSEWNIMKLIPYFVLSMKKTTTQGTDSVTREKR